MRLWVLPGQYGQRHGRGGHREPAESTQEASRPSPAVARAAQERPGREEEQAPAEQEPRAPQDEVPARLGAERAGLRRREQSTEAEHGSPWAAKSRIPVDSAPSPAVPPSAQYAPRAANTSAHASAA